MKVHKEFITTEDAVIAHNVNLDHLDVVGGVLDGAWIGHTAASVQQVRRTENEISFQLQVKQDYLKCICVTLRQNGGDVVAHVNFAAYATADHDVGYDFSAEQNSGAPVATSPYADGYGVAELTIGTRFAALVSLGEVVNIKAVSNGCYFCANDWGQPSARPILANRECPDEWEQFMFIDNDDCTVSIKSMANGKFLSSEIATDGRVIARAEVVDAWEKYWIESTSDGQVTLRSATNHKLLSVEPSIGTVTAGTDSADTWGKLIITPGRVAGNNNTMDGSNSVADIAAGATAIGGAVACATGVVAAATAATASAGTLATIGAVGSGVGAVVGGVIGSGIGLATGGGGIAATVPFAISGGALGCSTVTSIASTCASALGIATAPAWAVPVAIGGGVAAIGAGVYGVGRYFKWW